MASRLCGRHNRRHNLYPSQHGVCSFAGNNFDDRQIAEFAYNLCTAVLGGHTNSPEVKETVRKILSLANRAESVKVFGKVQEFNGVKHVTAKEKAE